MTPFRFLTIACRNAAHSVRTLREMGVPTGPTEERLRVIWELRRAAQKIQHFGGGR